MSGRQIWSLRTYQNIIIVNIKRSWSWYQYQYYQHQSKMVLLIVKYNVWSPNMVAWNVELLHATVFFRVPLQLVVAPKLKKINWLFCKYVVTHSNNVNWVRAKTEKKKNINWFIARDDYDNYELVKTGGINRLICF